MAAFSDLINEFENRFHREIKAHNSLDPVDGTYAPFPETLDSKLATVLQSQGIEKLFAHQDAAFSTISADQDTLLVSHTASGKTLSFQHVQGIGPVTERRIKNDGFQDWTAIGGDGNLPVSDQIADALHDELPRSLAALNNQDIRDLIERFDTPEHWRIMAEFFKSAAYFDIETSGFGRFSDVTMIASLINGQLQTFTRHQDLDTFLDLLDDVPLLVSFNGNSFDVPKLLDHYHIPELPCPHLDLRWLCYHCGYRGGLKEIEEMLGISRPEIINGVNGGDATWLWERWELTDDADALQVLRRYCAADVLTMPAIVAYVLQARQISVPATMHDVPWELLETA